VGAAGIAGHFLLRHGVPLHVPPSQVELTAHRPGCPRPSLQRELDRAQYDLAVLRNAVPEATNVLAGDLRQHARADGKMAFDFLQENGHDRWVEVLVEVLADADPAYGEISLDAGADAASATPSSTCSTTATQTVGSWLTFAAAVVVVPVLRPLVPALIGWGLACALRRRWHATGHHQDGQVGPCPRGVEPASRWLGLPAGSDSARPPHPQHCLDSRLFTEKRGVCRDTPSG
jgi:hypothetical protein